MEALTHQPDGGHHMGMKVSVLKIPEDVLIQIFYFCDPATLLAVDETCKEWHSICTNHDKEFWSHHIDRLWKNFTINRPTEVSVFQRISNLTTVKMVKMLRYTDLSRCVEKVDYQRMLLAKLLFEKRMGKELVGTDSRFEGRFLSMYYPDWALTMPVFKASFYHARRDVIRSALFTSELCAIRWRFRFKHYADAEGMTFSTIFYDDGTMESEVQEEEYQWKVSSFVNFLSQIVFLMLIVIATFLY